MRPSVPDRRKLAVFQPLVFAGLLLSGVWSACVANPMPDIPQAIDSSRVRVDIGSGHDRVLITGLQGAADPQSTRVQVQNLRSSETVEAGVGSDGSFSAEVDANPSQIFGLSQEVDGQVSPTIFVGGNASRSAVEVGTEEECYLLAEPTEDACLVCTLDGEAEIVGCNLDDFTDESVLNPANIAECLFLSSAVSDLYALPPEPGWDDVRYDEIQIFNNCGEPVWVEITALDTDEPDRFYIDPWPGESLWLDPTYFASVLIWYDGTLRAPGQVEADTATALIGVYLPDYGEGETFLGSLAIAITAY